MFCLFIHQAVRRPYRNSSYRDCPLFLFNTAFLYSTTRDKKKRKSNGHEVKAAKGQGVLLWLRMDLRLHDQPALDAASKRASSLGGPLAFCFLQSMEEDGVGLQEGGLLVGSRSAVPPKGLQRLT